MLEEIVPFLPLHFFSLELPCYRVKKDKMEKKHRLPFLQALWGKKALLEVSMGWHPEGLAWHFSEKVKVVELFLDTRDQKEVGYPTRFCHHFFFDLEKLEGKEVTRMRGEDSHELADPKYLQCTEEMIWIAKEALTGYDPAEYPRLGFTYRLEGGEQEFALSDVDFSIEKHPAFWASLRLEKS